MLLSSWVQSFRKSLRSKRRGHRSGAFQTHAWQATSARRTAARAEQLEQRTLLTALVIDQQFADTTPGVISIDNNTIDVNSDGTPEFDSIVIDTVTFDGAGGRGISINLSDITINRISIDELNITGTQGSGVDITLDNVNLNSLVIEKSNIASALGGGIDLNLTDAVVPTIAVYQSSILVTNGTGLDINIASQTRNARTDEIDIAESTIDGVSITAAGLDKSILTGTGTNPVAITSVDHGLQTGTEVTITGVQGLTAANTVDTLTVVDENVFTLDNADGTGQTYESGGTVTVFTTVNDIRVTDNTIGVSAGAAGLDIDLDNARAQGLTVEGNASIRSIGITLDDSPIDGLVVRDTTIDGTRPQVDALRFDLTNSTLTNLLIDNNTVQGDGVSGGDGVVFSSADSNVYGTFTNNTVDDTLGNGLSFSATASSEFLTQNRGPLAFDFNSFAADTALTAALDLTSTTLQVADGRSFQAQQVIQIDNEQMFVSAVNGDILTVVRGERGTLPVAHADGAVVRSVTSAGSGVARSISGNTFSNNDGAGFFTDLDPGTSVSADIRGNTFFANQLRAIDVTVEGTNAVSTQVAREGISRTASVLEVNDASVFSGFLFPFNVMVEGEEMTVTSIDGNNLNVTRAVNSTAARFHSANVDVIASQGDGLRLDVGGEEAADRNVMTFNRNGGVRITLQDDAAGSFDIVNNQITSVEGTDADAISVNLASLNSQVEARNILRRSSIRDNLIGTNSFTTLQADLSAILTVFTVADASSFTAGQDVRIDGEEFTINTIVGNTLTVSRGQNGTTANAHTAGSVVMAIDGGVTDRGIDFFIQESSAIEDILVDNNVIANNGDDGVRFQRFDEGITRIVNPRDGQTRAVTISNNTISGNARFPEVDLDIDDDGALEGYGAGVEIHTLNGTLDSFDVSIADNGIFAHDLDTGITLPTGSQVNGVNFRAEADAQIVGDVVRNRIQFNEDDGVHTSDRSNSGTDLRDISLSLFSNTISDNLDDGLDFTSIVGQSQVLVIGREGTDAQGVSLGNEISRNGNIGILFGPGAGSARAAIFSNTINQNGQVTSTAIGVNNGAGSVVNGSGIQVQTSANIAIKGNTFESNNGAGVDINSGGSYSVRDNTFQFNQNDGIEFLGSTEAVIHGNLFSGNIGRGIDVLLIGGSSNYEIGDGTEAGRNRVIGNQREGIYYVSTASGTQGQNVEASVPLNADGAVGAGGDAVFQADTNTITNNGIATSFSATGLVIRQGSTQGNSGSYFTNDTGTPTGYGSPENIAPNSRTNARIENNTFDGNFGDDARFETYVSTVNPQTTGEPNDNIGVIWDNDQFVLPTSQYHSDPLARLNLVFQGNQGNGLNAQAGGGSYGNVESVFKSRDASDNENATPTPEDTDDPFFPGPFPAGGTRGRSILNVPSRQQQSPGPFDPMIAPNINQNPAPDAVFNITDVQAVDIGNGVTELEVTLGLDLFGSYTGVVPFNDGDFIEVVGVNAVGGGIHSANGVYQVDIVDPGTVGVGGARVRLRNTTNDNGPGYANGGQLYFNLNTVAAGIPLGGTFLYPGTGSSTLRIAQGFDTAGGSPSDQFSNGSNFSPGLWGGWSPNLGRTGSVGNVVADPAAPLTRMLVTAPNHQLGNNRVVEITGVDGIPAANNTFTIQVVDANTFSIPTGINGTYVTGGSWVTLDDSYPQPDVPTFPLSDVIDITPDPRTGNTGIVTLDFTESVTGIDIDDLFLTRDGIPVDISSIFVQQVSPSRYQVDLSSVTDLEGQYSLTIDTERPEAAFVAVSPDPRLTAVDNITVNFTEDVTGVDIFDFTLLRDVGDGSGPQSVDLSEIGANLAVSQVTSSQYTIDLSTVTNDEGSYQLILNAPRTIGVGSIGINMSGEIEISAPVHALSTGQEITIEGVRGGTLGTATVLNGTFRVLVDEDDTFRLSSDGTLTTALAADDVSYNANGSVFSFDSGIIDQVGRRYSLTGLLADASASTDWVRGSEAPTVDIIDVDPDPRSSAVNEVTFVFSEPVVVGQVDLTDFTLTRNIGLGPFPVSLAGGTVTAVDDPGTGLATTFVLGNIAALTAADGDYRLTLISTGPTRIQDGQGNFLVFPAFDDWTMVNDEPAADILDVFPDPRTTAVGTVQFVFNNGDVAGVNLADASAHFTLTRDTGDGNGPQNVSLSGLAITQNTPASYSLDLTSVTSNMSGPIDGNYSLTLNPATGITLVSTGAPLAVIATDSWVQDTTGPTAEILSLSPDPRIQDAGVITIQFDEPVQGVDAFNAATDFSLTRDIGDGNGAQPVTLVGARVRAIGAVDSSGNTALPFSGGTIFSDTFVLDLSRTGLTDIDGTYALSVLATGAISDATGNAYVSTPDAADTWILVPKQVNDIIEDVVFANNPVTQDSVDLFFADTTAPFVVPGTVTVTPDPRSTAVGVVTVNFSESVTGVNLTDFVLTRDGGNVSLAGLTVNEVTQSQYTIDLNLVTGAAGDYVLSIQGTNSLIVDLAGNPVQTGLIGLDSWTVESIGPTATLSITTPRMTAANDLTVSFTKPVDVTQVDLTDLRLELDAGAGFIEIPVTGGSVTPGGAGAFEDSFTFDISADTAIEGSYRVTLVASDSGIVDQAGIELGADASTTFSVDMTAPTVDIIDIAPDPRNSSVGLVNVLFDEDVSGLDLANAETDFNLLFDDGMGGGQTAVSLASLTVTQETAQRYTIDLSTLTIAQGDYELQIVSNTGIQDIAGNSLEDAMLATPNLGALDTWFNGTDIVNPTVDIVDVTSPRNTTAGVVTINFSEDVSGVDIDDFTLTRDTGMGPQTVDLSNVNVTNAPGSASQYLIDLTDASFDEGTYTLSVVTTDPGTPIVDASGNPLVAGDMNTWVNTLIDPSAAIVPVTPDPRLRSAGIVTINFSEDVTGVDVSDFRLTRDTGAGALPVSLRGVSLTQSPSGADQYLLDLSAVSGTDGTYRLTLVAAGSGIESVAAGDDLTSDAFDEWDTVTTITVNTTSDTADVNPGDGIVADSMNMISLRAAIMEAGTLAGDDTILLPAGDYSLSIGGTGEEFGASGDLDIFDTTGTLTITGAGADVTTINASMIERIFHVISGATLVLDGVTITGGQVIGSEDGAGIRNDGGTVTIRNSVITGNRSFDDGGGINNAGVMTLIDTSVSANVATNNGGGIRNVGDLTIINSTIGGVVDAVAMTDTRNLAGLNGGGIINLVGGTLTITNTTISGNEVNLGSGGGLRNSGSGTLTNVTIANNIAGQRGGGVSAAGGSIFVQNTIIADNSAVITGNDVSVPGAASALVSAGNNLVEDTTDSMGVFGAAGDITGVDPLLGALQDNGGPTLTHALSLASQAFDNGALTPDATDQRGIPRVLGNGSPDIGAYEFGGFFVNSTADTIDVNPGDGIVADDFGRVTLRAAIMEANELANSGQSISNAIMLDNETYDLNLGANDTTGPTADVIDVTPDPLGTQLSMADMIDEIVVQFDEPVLNVDLSDFRLTFDDGMGGVTTLTLDTVGSAVLTPDPLDPMNPVQFTISGLQPSLAVDGLYTLDVLVNDITDFAGNTLQEDPAQTGLGVAASDQFTRGADIFAPTVILSQVAPATRTTNPGVVTLNFSENVFGVSTSAGAPNFTLTYDDGLGGGPIPVSLASAAVQQNSQSEYQLDLSTVLELNGLTDIGDYVLTFDGSSSVIQDAFGNLFMGAPSTSWTVVADTFAPTVTIDLVTPDPRVNAVGIVMVNFDEPVTGVDLANAETDFDLTLDVDGAGGMAPVVVDLSALTVTQVTDSQYTIDLTTVTTADGDYVLTLDPAAGSITDLAMTPNALVTGSTDTWTIGEDAAVFGDLDITNGTLSIFGVGTGSSIIDANDVDRVFDVASGVTFNLADLTVTGGNVVGPKDGGGIRSNGTVALTDAEVTANEADRNGGGIFSNGTLTLTTSTISDNTGDFGGGVFNDDGTVTVTESLISSNLAMTDGGGLFNDRTATVNILGSTLNGNMAGRDGAGIYNNDSGAANITDSAVTRNTATGDGGGLFSELAANSTLTNSTVAFNTAANGGGVFNQDGVVTVSLTSISANSATTDGGGLFVTSNGVVNASGSTFSGNLSTFNGGGISNSGTVNLDTVRVIDNAAEGTGGGINNARTLTLQATTVTGNSAAINGGGIANGGSNGDLTLTSSSVSSNTAGVDGGGLHISGVADISAMFSTVDSNSASGQGGGIYQSSTGTVDITSSTVSRNTAGSGGGIYSEEGFSFLNSTLSTNTATGNGGGLHNNDTSNNGLNVSLESATIFGNTAGGTGGGVQNDSVSGPVNVRNTIIARNTAPTDVDVSGVQFASQGNNLIGDRGSVTSFVDGVGGNIVGTTGSEVDPLLGVLQNNGGATQTHSLQFGSPARDGGSNVGVQVTDQRGFARVFDGDGNGLATIDVGAFESGFVANTFADTIDVLPGDRSSADVDGNSSLRAAVMEANALAGDDTILLIPGTYRLTIAGRNEDGAAKGDLDVSDNLTIIGAGVGQTFIDGADLDRIFHIQPGAQLDLQNLTIRNGEEVIGGAILNSGSLTLDNVIVESSTADVGGGLYNQLLQDSLAGDILAADTTLTLNDVSGFPVTGPFDIRIDTEEIRVTTVVGNTYTVTRGVNGTTAADHFMNDTITLVQELTITDATVRNNVARLQGGGLFNENELTLTRATFSGNVSHAQGGGLYNQSTATIADSTFDSNVADGNGGAIYNNSGIMSTSRVTITGSTLSNNEAATKGGGIYNNDFVTILNSTVSRNRADAIGGGIFNSNDTTPGSVTITNATIVENTTDGAGGGVVNDQGAFVDVQNTIIAANTALGANNDLQGLFVSLGTNFIGDAGTSSGFVNGIAGDQVGSTQSPFDAVFGPLADNGGPTLTHALLTGSPAIDAGNNSGGEPVDQRGGRRPTDDTADVGAFEIQDNRLSIGDVTQVEGAGGTTSFVFTVLLEAATAEPITVDFSTVQDTARAGEDFLTTSGTVTFAAGEQTQSIRVDVNGDTTPEGLEQFFVQLSNPVNATIIQNERQFVALTGAPTGGTFTLNFNDPVSGISGTSADISFDASAADVQTAIETGISELIGDIQVTGGPLAGSVRIEFLGELAGTNVAEFTVGTNSLTGGSNPAVDIRSLENAAIGTIQNDDAIITVAPASVAETDSGTTTLTFTVDLLDALGNPTTSANTITVNFATADGTAVNTGLNPDYVATSGTLTFNPGETSMTVPVTVIGDGILEPDETVVLNLTGAMDSEGNAVAVANAAPTGSILNDETEINITNVTMAEGDSGTTNFDFVVSLTQPNANTVTVDADTVNGSAISGSDFVANSQTITFAPGETMKTFTVAVNGDTAFEPDEQFTVQLSNPTEGGAADATAILNSPGTGTILNDENPPVEWLIKLDDATGTMLQVFKDTGSGPVLFDTAPNLTDPFSVTADTGVQDDVFTIDFVNGTPIPMNGLTIDGADEIGGDSIVVVNGSATDIVYTATGATSGTIDIDGSVITYADFEPITDSLTASTRTFDITHAGGHTIRLTDDTSMVGHSLIDSNGMGQFESVSFVNPTTSLTVTGSADADNFIVEPLDPGFAVPSGSFIINTGDGANTLDASTSTQNLVINGGAGDETLAGGLGNDTIDGGAGADDISGGAGGDNLTGGSDSSNDTIGGGAGNDVIDGGMGDDNITGGDDDDDITAGDGNDIADGGAGLDTVRGGMGNDTLSGGSESDTVTGEEGNDSITGDAGADDLDGGDDNDIVDGGDDADIVRGGSGDDVVSGGDGADMVFGDAGDDQLAGGAGVDQLDGGADTDSLTETATGSENITLTNTTITVGASTDNHTNMEEFNLTGGELSGVLTAAAFTLGNVTLDGAGGNDTLIGSIGNDSLIGGADNDLLQGGDGNDDLLGSAGNDVLQGQGGDDNLLGNSGNDLIDGGAGNDFANGDAGEDTVGGGADNDVLNGGDDNDVINGEDGDDQLFGDDGEDTIDGGAGNDLLFGRNDNDSLLGGAGNDLLVGENGNDMLDGQGDDDTVLGAAGVDTLMGGVGVDFLDGQGSSLDEIIINGTSVADTFTLTPFGSFVNLTKTSGTVYSVIFRRTEKFNLNTLDGDDTITSGDTSAIGRVDFIVDLGAGNDSLSLAGSNNSQFILFAEGRAGMDSIVGGEAADVINGGDDADNLDGANGNDTLGGGDGNDFLLGNRGNDSIDAGDGDDTLIGAAGADVLNADGGADFVRGNGGFDTIRGGAGNDTLFGDGSADTIFGGDGNDKIAGRQGNDDLYGEAGNDTLIGEAGEDFLDGGENVDLLAGGLGNDALVGSFGNDTLLGQEDNDTLYGAAGRDLLFGMQGNDFLKGQGTVNDTLVGGTGNNDEDAGDTYNASETAEIDNTFMLDTTLLTLLNF